MSKLITLAIFDTTFDVKFNLLKSMLEEAGIHYVSVNENMRGIEPFPMATPTNLAIEIRIAEEDMEVAGKILDSIE